MHYIIRYAEVGLKGRNRTFFEKTLIENIKNKISCKEVERPRGRIILKTDSSNAVEKLKTVFGIANFSPAKEIDCDLDTMKEEALSIIKQKNPNDFKIETKRVDKTFPKKSPQVNKEVGEYIINNTDSQVDLKDPRLKIGIEIIQGRCLIYDETHDGLRGLPVGCSGKVLSLLSGGIDSPVSSIRMMKRGCSVDFIHFHNYPYVKKESIDKIKNLFRIVNKYQNNARLFLIPFTEVQKNIVTNCPSKYRVLLYRRMMLKIAERISQKENLKALVTGESIGQVSSQTLDNMCCVEEAVSMPILRPLVGMDKSEIMDLSIKFSTYEESIKPHQDCCTYFIPRDPETKCKLDRLKKAENALDVEILLETAVKNMEVLK